MTGRFAPSPTGRMHLGNIFTALLAWLSVRSQGGRMLLRIEDLDPQRSRAAYAEQLRRDLGWLGLDWDGEMPPQSTRSPVYAAHFAKLEEQGLIYPCYCSRSELHDASAPHASDGTVLYSGACRDLTPEQRAAKTRRPAWRVRVPDIAVSFRDGVCGPQTERLAETCGDFIVRRSDGVYAYQLAVVCDDALGSVTEVVRGSDLLGSTARQLWLFSVFGYPAPQYYHVPLLVAPDGRRLSKRERDLDMEALRARCTPEQLVGRLAQLAGLQPGPEPVRAGTFLPFVCAAALHEAGHLAMLLWLRQPVHSLCLGLQGAVLRTGPLRYRDELLAAAAGPAMNLALLLAFSRTLPRFALVNFCLLAYNLLPFYPLDGGRLLRAVLRTLLPLRAAVWAERGVCLLCGALLLACAGYLTLCWHAGPWPLLVCLLLGLRCCRNEEI